MEETIKSILKQVKRGELSAKEGNRILQELKQQSLHNRNGMDSRSKHGDKVDTSKQSYQAEGIPHERNHRHEFERGNEAAQRLVLGENGDNAAASPFQAIILNRPGGIEDILVDTISPQEPGSKEVQIQVKAFSLNFGDLLCVKGLYPTMPEYPFSPGFEISGIVIQTGSEVTRVQAGDEVIGLTGLQLGGQSLMVNTEEHLVVRKPSNLSHEEACAFPIVYLTMRHVFDRIRLEAGEKVLIQTATGGTGLIAVQMALLEGAEIYATAGSEAKLDYLRQMGVHHVINYREQDFAKQIQQLTDGKGVDVVINTLSGDAIQKGLKLLAPGGRYMEIAMTGLKSAKSIDLSCLADNQTFYSIDLRKMMLSRKDQVTPHLDRMREVLEQGRIKPTVGKIFQFNEIKEAYWYMENRSNIGKIVVTAPGVTKRIEKTPSPSVAAAHHEGKGRQNREIAIIGMSCRFPGANHAEEFWELLASGRCEIREVPQERWDGDAYYDPDIQKWDKTHCKWGGFLDNIDQFDAGFFNISGKEAELSDPMQRLLLEECWNALEDAGYATDEISNTKCGVFAGISRGDYVDKMSEIGVPKEPQSFWGNHNSVSAARISYFLNLKGPSIAIDTACSSSLVSIHLGCQSIASGDSDMVLAGGVFTAVMPDFYIASSNASMLSPRGRSAAFDNDADGFVPGEGAAMLVLKALDAAERDGDSIYGVIKASGINQDGKTNGITAPSSLSQTELERQVYEQGNINPETISYVEAHGTGTKLGDPIEVEALTNAFRTYTERKQFCALGSVKTNIGHAVTAAGAASVIKVLLSFKHRKLVPSLEFATPNEHIDFENSPFYVNTELKAWEQMDGGPRRAAVSSFGFSGTNAHLVLEEPRTALQSRRDEDCPWFFIPVSARSETALIGQVERLANWLEAQEDRKLCLGDMAYTLLMKRKHFPARAAFLVRNRLELKERLSAFITGEQADRYASSANLRGSKKTGEALLREKNREHGNQAIEKLIKPGLTADQYEDHLLRIMKSYLGGSELNWERLYVFNRHRTVSMPTYAFEHKRYWLQAATGQFQEKRSHSLLSQTLTDRTAIHSFWDENISDLEQCQLRKKLTGAEFYMKDHCIGEAKVLPGAAFMEMARAAGEMLGKRKVRKLVHLVWNIPLKQAGHDPVEMRINVKAHAENDTVYEVYSVGQEQDSKIMHHHGRIQYEASETGAAREAADIAGVKARCSKLIKGSDFYPMVAERGLVLGESFQVIEEAFGNEIETFSKLRLPDCCSREQEAFFLHPSLLDGAFQTALLGLGAKDLYVPFSLGEIEIVDSLTTARYVHAVRRSEADAADGNAGAVFQIQVMDESGTILIKITDFKALPFHRKGSPSASEPHYFRESWEPSLTPEGKPLSTGEHILLLDDRAEVWEELCSIIPSPENAERAKGPAKRGPNVTRVVRGSFFRELGDGIYEIDPSLEQHYEQLMKALSAKQRLPQKIVYAWTKTHLETEELKVGSLITQPDMQAMLQEGFYYPLYLAKALLAVSHRKPIDWTSLLPYHKGASHPLHAAFSGFAKSVSREHSGWRLRSVEMQALSAVKVVRLLQSEWGETDDCTEVRYEQDKRYVKKIIDWHPSEIVDAERKQDRRALPWRTKGVYLITGGMGGIGCAFADYLARTCQARLVLAGRSALTAEQKEWLDSLSSLGSEALYIQADISKRKEVYGLLGEITDKFGDLNGILHCAGVIGDALLSKKTQAQAEQVLAPKVWGTHWLDEATRHVELDAFILFSSTAALIGNAGQADYGYANRYLDMFAGWRQALTSQGQRFGNTLSINWPLWKEGGMKLDIQTEKFLTQTIGMMPLDTKAGIAAVELGLQGADHHFAVLQGSREKLRKLLQTAQRSADWQESQSTEALNGAYREEQVPLFVQTPEQGSGQAVKQASVFGAAELAELLQHELFAMVAGILKISAEDIFLDEDMSDYGFDSLSLTEFSNALNQRFDLDLAPALFFEHPTLLSVIAFITAEYESKLRSYFGSQRLSMEAGGSEGQEDAANTIRSAAASADAPNAPNVSTSSPMQASSSDEQGQVFEPSLTVKKTKQSQRASSAEPVAIIGMSGIMPQSDNLAEFWRHLAKGSDLITEIPEDRWDWKSLYGDPNTERNKTNIKWGGFMKEIAAFDSLFFGISPKEAELMDPQQRIMLETVWSTIEDAGYKASDLSGTHTGLFIGVANTDYGDLQMHSEIQAQTSTGMSHCMLTNRISYLLNFHGPSEPIDTACSSSLVAIHRAVEQIQSGECELALAGGINTIVSPTLYISFNRAGMLCTDGRCKTFDKDANGYVRGEGAACLLLKPLSKAEADGDHIYGVIRGTAVNHGGRANSLTAPNPNAQADLIVRAWRKANVDPATASYIETHGTGTPLGDPIEINGLKKAFAQLFEDWGKEMPDDSYCGIGSVKTNIGHLETAAGIAGVCKVLLSMKHGLLPASIHFNEMNPYIQLENSPFYIVNQTVGWERKRDAYQHPIPRRAGISSFGFGGVNSHVVIEEYCAAEPQAASRKEEESLLFIWSAQNEEALRSYVEQMIDFLENEDTAAISLADIAYTLQVGREDMEERFAVVASSRNSLLHKLKAYSRNSSESHSGYIGTVTAQVKKRRTQEGAGQERVLETWKQKQWDLLAEQWTAGEEMKWEALYAGDKRKRVSLPTYPFLRVKHWLPEAVSQFTSSTRQSATVETSNQLHPFIHQNQSSLSEVRFYTCFSGDEAVLQEHIVNGQHVLPGVVYLEMALSAGKAAMEATVHRIRNVIWARPAVSGGGEMKLYTRFKDIEAGKVEYEMYSRLEDGSELLHAQGEVLADHAEPLISTFEPPSVLLNEVRSRCTSHLGSEACYLSFQQIGLSYGEHFKGIEHLYYSTDECVADIRLPDQAASTFDRYELHYSIIDSALQSVMGLLLHDSNKALYVPFSLGELKVHAIVPKACCAYITRTDSPHPSSETHLFNILITDREGRVCIEMIGFMVRAYSIKESSPGPRLQTMGKPSLLEVMKQVELGQLNADEADKIMEEILNG